LEFRADVPTGTVSDPAGKRKSNFRI